MPLVVIVCGGVDHKDAQFVYDELSLISRERGGIDFLIEGGAAGADRQASNWAIANGVPTERVKANWKEFGKRAGPLRNEVMLQKLLRLANPKHSVFKVRWAALVVAFPSKRMNEGRGGTLDMITRARAARVSILLPRKEQSNDASQKRIRTPILE